MAQLVLNSYLRHTVKPIQTDIFGGYFGDNVLVCSVSTGSGVILVDLTEVLVSFIHD